MGCENRALKLDGVKTSALHIDHQNEGTIHKTDNTSSMVRRIH
jgi:hypothetical protein